MSPARVSVVIPTYNRAQLLPRAVDSVLNQTLDEFQLIVVDDGSTDETPSVMKSYTDDRISYVQLTENRGANAARNEGIRTAAAPYISFLDSDDAFLPTHLETVITELDDLPESIGGVYTTERFIQDSSVKDINYARAAVTDLVEVVRDYQVGGFSCLTFRSKVFNEIGLLDESLDAFQDRDFLIRFLDKYDLAPISEELVEYYLHQGRLSENTKMKLSALNQLTQKHQERFDKKGEAYIHYTRGFLYVKIDQMPRARHEFRQAVKKDPTKARYYLQVFSSQFGKRTFRKVNELKKSVYNTILRLYSGLN
ncbi:glycosyltransferase family 2 protein [Haloplanus natans]|uniref:glycosyltransferase family 2 protein n=1 Tax=Haloplanus natans TaxID=376171 RepID=UPI0006779809|nr:glycosyltransferase family 2 protein [Haloplanus natans]